MPSRETDESQVRVFTKRSHACVRKNVIEQYYNNGINNVNGLSGQIAQNMTISPPRILLNNRDHIQQINPSIPNYFQFNPYPLDPTRHMGVPLNNTLPYPLNGNYPSTRSDINSSNSVRRVSSPAGNSRANNSSIYNYYQDTLVNLSLLCKHVEFDKYGRHVGKFCWEDIHSKSTSNLDNMDACSKETKC